MSSAASGGSGTAASAASPPPPAATMAVGNHVAARAPAPIAPPGYSDRFANAESNPATAVRGEQAVSTFSLDVDTASYAISRRFLSMGRRPPAIAVRAEQFVNYFPCDYARPESRERPFAIQTMIVPNPWNAKTQLLHIGLKAYELRQSERPPANVELLLDVSGSMAPQDRLPLLKQVFRAAASELRPVDRVSIVTYASGVATVLEPTSGAEKDKILDALDRLSAGGGTAGSDGIQRAYAMAERNFDPKAVNRVILATDGDFNVGITDLATLRRFVSEKKDKGIYLSIFGVGLDNLNDSLMTALAHAGNGNAAYIDSALEGRKALVSQLGATVFPVADDAKIQIEFNPARVAEYRLVGYETRLLCQQDLNDDRVDAGDIGSGHSVTAIYEIALPGRGGQSVDPLRYQPGQAAPSYGGREFAFLKLRYKLPGEKDSRLMEQAVTDAHAKPALADAPEDVRFAIAAAGFAQLLRGESQVRNFGYEQVVALAEPARGRDEMGYRAEFLRLVRVAGGL
jgi:Ca-activated chloride channel family protein